MRRLIRIFTLCLSLLLSLFLLALMPQVWAPLDQSLNDWRTRFSLTCAEFLSTLPEHPILQEFSAAVLPKLPASLNLSQERRVIIVDIDEQSLREQGAWPWPRQDMAQLIKILIDEYAVAGVALDIVFPEARSQDDELAQQFNRPQVTGAVVYDLEQRGLPPVQTRLAPVPPLLMANHAPVLAGIPTAANHAEIRGMRSGHITPLFDSDGSVRHLPPMLCSSSNQAGSSSDSQLVKSAQNNQTNSVNYAISQHTASVCRPLLGIAAFMGMLEQPSWKMYAPAGWLAPAWELQIFDAQQLISRIPLDPHGLITIPYRHRQQDWISLPASAVLQKKIDPALLRGSLVLLGSTALGMADVIATPLSAVSPGLMPHAQVVSALFDQEFMYQPAHSIILLALFELPFAVFLLLGLQRYTAPVSRAVLLPLWLLVNWLCALVLAMACYVYGILLPLTPLLIFAPLTILLILSLELYLTGRAHVSVIGVLATYLPQQIARRLAGKSTQAKNVTLDVSRREITVLFADIRSFTALTEQHSPETMALLMQRIFTEMAQAVANHQGTIDKFIGDAIMAFWNAPDDDLQHASHALAAAQEIVERISALREFCLDLGVEPVVVGVGIESGQALVGHFGSEHRRTYTALGEPVVLASRIEGLSREYEQPVLIGQSCAELIGTQHLQALGEVKLRGRQQLHALYVPKVPIERAISVISASSVPQ